jgi:hypothetical protein
MLLVVTACAAFVLGQAEIPLEENAPPEFPRTVRRGDQICYQSIDAQGQIQSDCRAASATGGAAASQAAVTRPSEADTGFVAALGVLGGFEFLSVGAAGPQLQLYGEAGGHVASKISIVGVVDASLGFLGGGRLTIVTFGPGVRIGQRTSATVYLGASFPMGSVRGVSVSDTTGKFAVTGVFPVAGPFSILGHAGVTLNLTVAIFSFGVGVGASF